MRATDTALTQDGHGGRLALTLRVDVPLAAPFVPVLLQDRHKVMRCIECLNDAALLGLGVCLAGMAFGFLVASVLREKGLHGERLALVHPSNRNCSRWARWQENGLIGVVQFRVRDKRQNLGKGIEQRLMLGLVDVPRQQQHHAMLAVVQGVTVSRVPDMLAIREESLAHFRVRCVTLFAVKVQREQLPG